jgi:hypothetical protein
MSVLMLKYAVRTVTTVFSCDSNVAYSSQSQNILSEHVLGFEAGTFVWKLRSMLIIQNSQLFA